MKFHSAPPEHWTPRKRRGPAGAELFEQIVELAAAQGLAGAFVAQALQSRARLPGGRSRAGAPPGPVQICPSASGHSAVPFLLGRPVERLVGAGKMRGAARDRLGIEPADRADVAADAHAFVSLVPIARVGRGLDAGRRRRSLRARPGASRAAGAARAGRVPGTRPLGRIAARPRTPAPRLRRMTRVSAWSSA